MYHVEVGDLVRYTGTSSELIGVIVSISDISGRAKVHLQHYNEFKFMEIKYLMKVNKIQRPLYEIKDA